MINRELAAALRICSRQQHCDGCPYFDEKDPLSIDCIRAVMTDAANAMRNNKRHVLALQKEIEKLRRQLEVERRPQWVSVEERLPEPPKEDA